MSERDEITQQIEEAIDATLDVSFESVKQGEFYDVVAWSGKRRMGVVARTRYEAIADTLVRALLAESSDAEVEA